MGCAPMEKTASQIQTRHRRDCTWLASAGHSASADREMYHLPIRYSKKA